MANEKHKRLLNEEQFAQLSDDVKKRTVRLNGGFYIVYPAELAADSFKLRVNLKNESEKVQIRNRDEAKNSLSDELTNNDFKLRNQKLGKFIINGSSVLDKDWRLFKKASPEMDWVKKSMNALNSVLSEPLEQYINENGVFDTKKYQERLEMAYDEFITAAQNYCDVKNPSSWPGKRRKIQVAALLKRVKQMKLDSKNIIESIREGAIDFNNIPILRRQELDSFKLVNEIVNEETATVAWQNEGNSTDVYKVTLKGIDGKNYYLKENLPFLNENIEAFLSRRYKQLDTSYNNRKFNETKKANEEEKPEEDRLFKISDKDYENGKKLLKNLSDALKDVSDDKRSAAEEKFSKYFAYNFDDIFRRLEVNNILADFTQGLGGRDIDQEIREARDKGDQMLLAALQMAKSVLEAENNGAQPVKYEKMTAEQWLKKEMNLDDNEDKAFLKSIKGLSAKELETMFRVTMGKEVELFGQMSAQKVQNGNDKAAINNTATSRVAEYMGFDDVVTKSKTALVKFQRRDGTEVNQLCTICEEAPGIELVDLMKEAEKDGKQISYSSEAIRDMMRLYLVDSLTLQKDRHGRNFKCEVERQGNVINIKSTKAYDNDMSFDALTLAEAFKDGNQKLQFLPNPTIKAEKGSALYKYIVGSHFGVDVLSPKKPNPTPSIQLGGRFNFNLKGDTLGWGPFLMFKKYNNLDYDSMKFWNRSNTVKLQPDVSEEAKKKIHSEMDQMGIKIDPKSPEDAYRHYALEKFIDLKNKIYDVWVDKEALKGIKNWNGFQGKGYKKNLSYEEKKQLAALVGELEQLGKQFDFSKMLEGTSYMATDPVVDGFIKSVVFEYNVVYGDTLENRVIGQVKDLEALRTLMDNNGNLEIPNMLHCDAEGYRELKAKVTAFEDKNSAICQKLRELGLSDEKIDALAARNREMLNQIDQANIKAQAFYKLAGWTEKPKSEFFLEKEDYKNLDKLTDFAIDPGRTYLAVENENFLAGQTVEMRKGNTIVKIPYKDLMSEDEITMAKNINESIQNDDKRWKYDEAGKNRKAFDKANTMNAAANSFDGKEYIRCCMEDEIYNIAHADIKNVQDLSTVFWKALYLNTLVASADKIEKPLPIDKAKALLEDQGNARETYEKALNSTVGKIYKGKMDAAINTLYDDNHSYKKFDTDSFKKINEKCMESTMNDVLAKLSEANPDPEKIAKYLRSTESLAKQFGVDLSAESAFNAYAAKNNLPEQLKQAVKNAGLKPEEKKEEKVEEKGKKIGEGAPVIEGKKGPAAGVPGKH